jgi:hypothetical protein
MSFESVTRFWEWFDEARGDLSIRQVEERAKCPRGRIGNPYSAKREPTSLVCTSIAEGLNLDKKEVFKQAGLLDPEPDPVEQEEEFINKFRQLPSADRKRILLFVDSLWRDQNLGTQPNAGEA